jgi:hypothetical protein
MGRRKWTFEEDQIVRSHRGKAAARQLPGRTAGAVGARRKKLGIGPSPNYWTKREDRRILKTAALPVKKAVKRFKKRSAAAILVRRQRFGCHIRKPNALWNTTEMKLLEQMWPTCTRSEIKSALPRHPFASLSRKASELGLHKVRTFDLTDLLGQIKSRLHEERISCKRLAAEIGCGESFLRCRTKARHDFNKIAKVAEFFGGRLVVDWQDG